MIDSKIFSTEDFDLIEAILDKASPDPSDIFFKGIAQKLIRMSALISNTNTPSKIVSWIKLNIIDGNLSDVIKHIDDSSLLGQALTPYLNEFFPRPSLKGLQKAKRERMPTLLVDEGCSRFSQYIASEIAHGLHSDTMHLLERSSEEVYAALKDGDVGNE